MPIEIKELIIKAQMEDSKGDDDEHESTKLVTEKDLEELKGKIVQQITEDGDLMSSRERRDLIQDCLSAVEDFLDKKYSR